MPFADASSFRKELLDSDVLVATSVDGLYHRSATFEGIVKAIERLVSAAGVDQQATELYFSPLIPRQLFERTDYLKSFPDLTGSIDTFVGSDADHAELLRVFESGADWTQQLVPAEVVLCSAACHPLYPSCTGTVREGGQRYEVHGHCFRHEPSLDPARMQSFRQHEFVYVGDPEGASKHRDLWLGRAVDLLSGLGLQVEAVIANDPFFGRAGRMLAANQQETALKFEVVTPITSEERPTAISSANCHEDHFGVAFDIRSADGGVAHTSCIGFGLERITLALLRTHGFVPDAWPASVRDQLWP